MANPCCGHTVGRRARLTAPPAREQPKSRSDTPALNLAPLTLLYASVTFALACAVRGRGIPVGVAVALAVGGFILNGLAPLVDTLRPYREWTIYYLFTASKPFSTGINLAYTAILLAGSV